MILNSPQSQVTSATGAVASTTDGGFIIGQTSGPNFGNDGPTMTQLSSSVKRAKKIGVRRLQGGSAKRNSLTNPYRLSGGEPANRTRSLKNQLYKATDGGPPVSKQTRLNDLRGKRDQVKDEAQLA